MLVVGQILHVDLGANPTTGHFLLEAIVDRSKETRTVCNYLLPNQGRNGASDQYGDPQGLCHCGLANSEINCRSLGDVCSARQ